MKMRTDDTRLVPLADGMSPLRWQAEAMLAIRRDLREHSVTMVSAATGTGKGTLAAALCVKAARAGKRVLFLVHMDELITDVMARAVEIEPALYAGKVKAKLNEIDRDAVFASVQTLKGKRLDDLDAHPFDYVITDECFVAGTPILMADGSERPIEDVRVGDVVIAYDEEAGALVCEAVEETMVRRTMRTVTLTTGMVRLRCTANHPVFTRRGWVPAGEITTDDEVKCATVLPRHLRPLRRTNGKACTASLAPDVLRAMPKRAGAGAEAAAAMLQLRGDGAGRHRLGDGVSAEGARVLLPRVRGGVPIPAIFGDDGADKPARRIEADDKQQPDDKAGDSRKGGGYADRDGAQTTSTGRQRSRPDCRRGSAVGGTGVVYQRDLLRRPWEASGLPDALQDRRGQRCVADRDRDRRRISQRVQGPAGGSEEAGTTHFARVDRVEVHEQGGDGAAGGVPVYNFSVRRVHTYVAGGVVVHNCHHSTSRSYRAIYARVEKVNPAWRHILLTATPFRNAGGGKTEGLGAVCPRLAYEYSLGDAIAEGALVPLRGIKVHTEIDLTGVDPDDEEEIAKRVDVPSRNHVVAETYVAHCVEGGDRVARVTTETWADVVTEVRRTVVSGGVRKQGIVFAATIQHARNIAEELVKWGIAADAVWGLDKQRASKIAAFKSGQLDVLCNNNLLSEGFDHKPTGAVLLCRPTQSRGLYAQQVGRVTRKSPGKAEGLVIDFVANSDTHSLASLADLSTPDADLPRINPGDEVRHRRFAAKSKGVVESVDGWVSNDEQGTARVLWRQGDADLGIVGTEPEEEETRYLVLVRPAAGSRDEEVVINPTVIGVNEFSISLFGEATQGRRVGWYTFTDSKKRKTLVAKGKHRDESAMLRSRDDRWEAWRRSGLSLRCVAVGTFAECEAAVSDLEPDDYTAEWLRKPASEKQIDVLRKFGIRREGLSRGEASMILELKFIGLRISQGAVQP